MSHVLCNPKATSFTPPCHHLFWVTWRGCFRQPFGAPSAASLSLHICKPPVTLPDGHGLRMNINDLHILLPALSSIPQVLQPFPQGKRGNESVNQLLGTVHTLKLYKTRKEIQSVDFYMQSITARACVRRQISLSTYQVLNSWANWIHVLVLQEFAAYSREINAWIRVTSVQGQRG